MLWLIAIMVATLLGISYLAKNQHHVAQQRHYLYAKHSSYITRMQNLIDQLPEQYVPKEIHLLLIEEIIAHLQQQWQLFPHNRALSKYIEVKVEQRNHIMKNHRSLNIEEMNADDLKKANRIRKRLHQLCQFTERAVNLKKITRPEGIQYVHTMKSLSTEVAVGFHKALAEKALQRHKMKMASYYYTRAITEYRKYNPHGRYDKSIEDLQGLLDNIRAKEKLEVNKEKKKISARDSTRLTIELNELGRRGFPRAAA